MEPDETRDQREHHPEQPRQPAPASLYAGIMDQLERRKTYLSAQKPHAELLADLHHPQWEVRALAVQSLGASDEQVPLVALETALQDAHRFVRLAAIGALEQSGSPISRNLLLAILRDHDWQVREMATLALAKNISALPEKEALLLLALEDANVEVRDAAAFVFQQTGYNRHQSPHAGLLRIEPGPQEIVQERTHISMTQISHLDSSLHEDAISLQQDVPYLAVVSAPRVHRLRWSLRHSLVAVALLALVIAVTAATLNWWNPLYGKPDQYQAIGQSQTHNGATITITRAYADQGRTIVAYNISYTNPSKELIVGISNLYSEYAQAPGVLSDTPCSALQSDGVIHCYFTTQAFQVPTNVNTLTLTWDITRLLVTEPGVKEQSNATIDAQWHFVFTVPFHHSSDTLPGPPDGNIYH